MTKPIAVIVGATGGQGGSVVDSFLKDGTYQVRAITRKINSEKAVALRQRGVEVVTGDLNDESSLVEAFKVCRSPSNQSTYLTIEREQPSFSRSPTSSSPSQPKGPRKQSKSSQLRESTSPKQPQQPQHSTTTSGVRSPTPARSLEGNTSSPTSKQRIKSTTT